MSVGDFVQIHEWLALANGSGVAFQNNSRPDRTLQITGVFDGATIVFEGSNVSNDSNFLTLTDIDAAVISYTVAPTKLLLIRECPAWVRPTVTGGGGSEALNIYLSNT